MFRESRRRFTAFPAAHFALLVLVVLAGLVLRVYKLDAQSFWYDEGNSARIAERSLQLIVEGAAGDIHPPLYYLALHFWRAVFGESMFALRLFSVVCGVLLVIFTFLLGRRAFGRPTGLVAAALIVFSPFAVYYSQEARMYILLALEAAISTWALLALGSLAVNGGGRGPRRRAFVYCVCYVAATAAGLYTQYAYPFVMVAQGVCVLLGLLYSRANRGPAIAGYVAMNVVAIALFLPWLPIAIRQVTSWTVAPQDYELGTAVLDALRWLVAGRTLPLAQALLPISLAAVLAIAGFVSGLSSPPRTRMTVCLLVLTLLPFVLLFAFKLYREAYLKFLLVCVAPLVILVAYGICGLAERAARLVSSRLRGAGISLGNPLQRLDAWEPALAGILTLAFISTWLPSLANLYDNPAYARDDYRGIARMIESNAQPADAILFSAPNQWEVFTYYHRQGAPAIPFLYRPENDAVVEQQLVPIVAQYARLFVLYYGERESDPDGKFERWLAAHAFKADEQWIGNIRLAVYATRSPVSSQKLSAQKVGAVFGNGIGLQSVDVDLGAKRSGDMLPLRLVWQPTAKPDRRYKVFVHLGLLDAPPVAQNDAEPGAGFWPTDSWNAGDEIADQRAVWIKPGVPPGDYGVYVGVYDLATGQRLPISAADGKVRGDRLWLGDIRINAGR